jgi:hypothetical protein
VETEVLKDIITHRILSFNFLFRAYAFSWFQLWEMLVFVYFSILFLCRAEAFLPIDGEVSPCCLAAMSVYLLGMIFSLIYSREYSKAVLKHIQLGNVVSLDFVKNLFVY